jgi:hypothetical protein
MTQFQDLVIGGVYRVHTANRIFAALYTGVDSYGRLIFEPSKGKTTWHRTSPR